MHHVLMVAEGVSNVACCFFSLRRRRWSFWFDLLPPRSALVQSTSNRSSFGGLYKYTSSIDMSMQEMLRIGDDDDRSDALERELKEKLKLRGDASPAKCTRQEQRWRSDHGIVDARESFVQAYGRLRDDLVGDDSCELTDEARRWLAQVYWRRDQICWYRRPEVGLRGINDGIILKCHILIMIKKYFREKPYFLDLLEIWSEISLQTSLGQMLDLIGTHTGADDLAKYSIEGYRRIVKYKTAYYSFYLPAVELYKFCPQLLHESFSDTNYVLQMIIVACSTSDDYLDCFADPNTIGKIGTDIEDHKCSWLIVQALGHADNNQIEVLHRNYGKKDSSSVSEVKRTYTALDLKDIFSEFERRCYNHLVTSIEAQKDHAAREILKSFLCQLSRSLG